MRLRQFMMLSAFPAAALGAVVAHAVVDEATPPAAAGSCAACSSIPAAENETAGIVFIPGGTFTMGADAQRPEERQAHWVRVDGFWIDRHEVTNAQFAILVAATSYVTLAERGLDPASHPVVQVRED
jgi:formylglycine-generating enzyme